MPRDVRCPSMCFSLTIDIIFENNFGLEEGGRGSKATGAPYCSVLAARKYLWNIFNGKYIFRHSDLFFCLLNIPIYPFWIMGLLYGLYCLKQKVCKQGSDHYVEYLKRIFSETCQEITPNIISIVLREYGNKTIKCFEKWGRYVEASGRNDREMWENVRMS